MDPLVAIFSFAINLPSVSTLGASRVDLAMSSDLLAEFDTFYRAPQNSQTNTAPASNDLSFLNDSNTKSSGQSAGNFQQWQNPNQPAVDIWGGMTNFQASTKAPVATSDNIWGSFEAATDPAETKSLQPGIPVSFHDEHSARLRTNTSQDKPVVVRRPTLDLFSSKIEMVAGSEPFKSTAISDYLPPHQPPIVTKSSDGEVLFDADELSGDPEDDDFGDFESVEPGPTPQTNPSQSLDAMFGAISLDSKSQKRPANLLSNHANKNSMLPYPQAPKSPSFRERNPFADLGLSTKPVIGKLNEEKPKSPSPVTAWPTYEPQIPKPNPYKDSPTTGNQSDDDWGDFADLPPETPAPKSVEAPSNPPGIEVDAWTWDAVDEVAECPPAHDAAPPPTNIPPPSVLLALFPSIFDLPQSALFKPVANQPFSLKNRIMSDPSTVKFLQAYLLLATVAARILAGRKLRWKRDTLLSQAMKIGQASAGGKSGMKLAGVDKAEITREDREAAEVARVWKDQLGRLRSAVAVANSSIHDHAQHLAIPNVSEAMHVKTEDGALTAPKPCLICGLKREERVNKVDIDVEDSFGEWWVDHWGHRACKNFWLEHEAKLRRR